MAKNESPLSKQFEMRQSNRHDLQTINTNATVKIGS